MMMTNIVRTVKLVRVTEEHRMKAMAFASASIGTMDDEGCHDLSKNRADVFQGKEAEFVVYQILTDAGFEVSEPDLKVYPRGEKNHDPDLVISTGERLHVKSCDDRKETKKLRKGFPPSWIFQANGLECGEKDFVFFVRRVEEALYCIDYIVRKTFLRDADLFKDPIAKKYQGKKYAVYRKDLEAAFFDGD